jgi:hypothetical protein
VFAAGDAGQCSCIRLTSALSLRSLLLGKIPDAWIRVLRAQLIRSGMKSGGPAAVPSSALVSDRPTVFLTASRNTTPYRALYRAALGAESYITPLKHLYTTAEPAMDAIRPKQHSQPLSTRDAD